MSHRGGVEDGPAVDAPLGAEETMRTQTEEPLMSQDYSPSGLSYSPGLRVKEQVNRGQSDHDHRHQSADVIVLDRAAGAPHLVKDLVCGMTVDANTTPHAAAHRRRTD